MRNQSRDQPVRIVASLCYGWGLSYFKFGANEWGTVNRLLGLPVLAVYLLAGALFGAFFAFSTRVILLKFNICFVVLVYLVFVVVFVFALFPLDYITQLNWYPSQFSGLTLNRNIFAFQMLLVLSLLLSAPLFHASRYSDLLVSIVFFMILPQTQELQYLPE